ncbi:MAG: type II secretion system protein N [Ideonella sp.]|nr:type II secretion system protein N [Ideonella sp.]
MSRWPWRRRSPKASGWAPSELRPAGGGVAAASGWAESTFAEMAWERARRAATRWGLAGAVVGSGVALVAFAPAAWLASAVASATGDRLLLADARGTVWTGSAVVVLTGGPGSRDASALPGRLDWSLRPATSGLVLQARQACCLNGTVTLRVTPGLGQLTATLVPPAGWVGQWPTAWLGGLGTPWNTMQLGGVTKLSSPGLSLRWAAGRWQLDGRVDVDFTSVASRLSTLDTLGSYRLGIAGDPASPGTAQVTLGTIEGGLQLTGNGTLNANGFRFRGEARSTLAEEAPLTNLLNIIGRRDGARSVISIG